MTDSAISGPIPSPGKRVARIGSVAVEEKALAAAATIAGEEREELGFAAERIWVVRLPRARLSSWEAMIRSFTRKKTGNRK